MTISRHVLLIAAALAAVGCTHPLEVVVVDSLARAPVAGAHVTRSDLKRPYFIVGAFVPKEERVTDNLGVARLDNRGGILNVSAQGYKHRFADIERKADSMTVELDREPPRGP